jgi:hypothetical protein
MKKLLIAVTLLSGMTLWGFGASAAAAASVSNIVNEMAQCGAFYMIASECSSMPENAGISEGLNYGTDFFLSMCSAVIDKESSKSVINYFYHDLKGKINSRCERVIALSYKYLQKCRAMAKEIAGDPDGFLRKNGVPPR